LEVSVSTEAKLLLLPGNNRDQREWIGTVRHALVPLFRTAVIVTYEHWEREDAPYIDFERELAKLEKLAAEGPWIALGKSAGVLLTLMAAARGILVPEKAFFLGAPFSWTLQQGMPVADLLAAFPAPTVFIQQSDDPGCPVDALQSILSGSGMKRYEIEEIPGASHDYGDLALIRALVEKHLPGS
jgi:predicted alpha/beta-hydrolase family hydrolase